MDREPYGKKVSTKLTGKQYKDFVTLAESQEMKPAELLRYLVRKAIKEEEDRNSRFRQRG